LFGYVQPLKGDLRVHELETFRGYYCSLCKALGKRYGKKAQFLLTYDCAFLALLLDSLHYDDPVFQKCRCAYNPLKRKRAVKGNLAVDYAADVNMLLAYHKLKDDRVDTRSAKAAMGSVLFWRCGKKAILRRGTLARQIGECVAALSELERAGCADIDEAAHWNARMLQKIFDFYPEYAELKEIGYNLGRWVYLMDALDDMQEDEQKGNYNVFLCKYGSSLAGAGEEIAFMLQFSLAQAALAFEKLPVKRNRGILENILYAGVMQKTEAVLKKRGITH
jgi:hypothetical protein